MKNQWEIGKRDIEFLEDVAHKEMGIVAKEWAERMGWEPEKAEANAWGWLHRIRVRVTRAQNYVNRIYGLQRKYPRIRKLTTSGALPESVEDMENY